MSETTHDTTVRFADLPLCQPVLSVLEEIGYDTPTPIQAKAIPVMMDRRDLIGQAQTGTGKTAAFALPLLSMLDAEAKKPQAIILAPTRELALQVAEAISKYGDKLRRLGVAAIYGGSDFHRQFKALAAGPAIVVGTPGRVMDHIRRGSLDLSSITHVVLDEADEMLRMGFIEDVEWILEHAPATRQTALFSATMPPRIAAIARDRLRDPVTISIKTATATVETIRQRFIQCSGMGHKLEVLADLLEIEDRDGAIVFTRTKSAASLVADELVKRGHAAEAIHGDVSQSRREKAVSMLKSGELDLLVATDVAARGLDVDRISHVFNFDIPEDPEPYVHRIGRAGRAGRHGDAILLVTRRDLRQLREIERVTRQRIEPMDVPTRATLEVARQRRLEARLRETIERGPLASEKSAVDQACAAIGADAQTVAAALLRLLQPGRAASAQKGTRRADTPAARPFASEPVGAHPRRSSPAAASAAPRDARPPVERRAPTREHAPRDADAAFERYRIEVGHAHRVKPGNIVGAIANEAGLDGSYIGRIDIYDDHSLIDLPVGMPREILNALKKTWVAGQQLRMSRLGATAERKFAAR